MHQVRRRCSAAEPYCAGQDLRDVAIDTLADTSRLMGWNDALAKPVCYFVSSARSSKRKLIPVSRTTFRVKAVTAWLRSQPAAVCSSSFTLGADRAPSIRIWATGQVAQLPTTGWTAAKPHRSEALLTFVALARVRRRAGLTHATWHQIRHNCLIARPYR